MIRHSCQCIQPQEQESDQAFLNSIAKKFLAMKGRYNKALVWTGANILLLQPRL